MDNEMLMGTIPADVLLDMILPFKVYEVLSETCPDSEGPLMMIAAAFENENDARDFIKRKADLTGKKFKMINKRK